MASASPPQLVPMMKAYHAPQTLASKPQRLLCLLNLECPCNREVELAGRNSPDSNAFDSFSNSEDSGGERRDAGGAISPSCALPPSTALSDGLISIEICNDFD